MNNLLLAATLTIGLISCSKECESVNPICKETPPTQELCLAYFERWFYNEQTNNCEKISYSGCSIKGFETKIECQECGCN
jgi:hypothetical protein